MENNRGGKQKGKQNEGKVKFANLGPKTSQKLTFIGVDAN